MGIENQSILDQKLKDRFGQKSDAFLFVCQITSFNEAKINKIMSGQSDMILNFDFFVQKGI